MGKRAGRRRCGEGEVGKRSAYGAAALRQIGRGARVGESEGGFSRVSKTAVPGVAPSDGTEGMLGGGLAPFERRSSSGPRSIEIDVFKFGYMYRRYKYQK